MKIRKLLKLADQDDSALNRYDRMFKQKSGKGAVTEALEWRRLNRWVLITMFVLIVATIATEHFFGRVCSQNFGWPLIALSIVWPFNYHAGKPEGTKQFMAAVTIIENVPIRSSLPSEKESVFGPLSDCNPNWVNDDHVRSCVVIFLLAKIKTIKFVEENIRSGVIPLWRLERAPKEKKRLRNEFGFLHATLARLLEIPTTNEFFNPQPAEPVTQA